LPARAVALVLATLSVLVSGAAQAQAPAGSEAGRTRQMSPLGLLPASYVSADGATPRWQVDLLPGGVYQRRVGPAGRAIDEIGRYQIEGQRLTLSGAREGPVVLELLADGRLRPARPGVGPLQRLAVAAPIEPRLRLAGLFTYFADAPRIVLCADGRSLPVAQAGDYLALERAYGQARSAPGAPLWVEVEGLIAPRPAMEPSQPPQATLVVERHLRVDPQGGCPGPVVDRTLEGTDWRSTEPGSTASLRFDGGRLHGSDGCNRLSGPYDVQPPTWRLGPLASTRMACATGQAQADAFQAALARAAGHRIQGDVLELRDAQGATVLRLQARP
jgi:heat shock protein HslJ